MSSMFFTLINVGRRVIMGKTQIQVYKKNIIESIKLHDYLNINVGNNNSTPPSYREKYSSIFDSLAQEL